MGTCGSAGDACWWPGARTAVATGAVTEGPEVGCEHETGGRGEPGCHWATGGPAGTGRVWEEGSPVTKALGL